MVSTQELFSAVAQSFTLQLLVTFCLLLTYPVNVAVYNIYFHPLSRFPGPKSWAATYVPYIKALLEGKLIQSFAIMHRKYGDVIRVGPNEISFATDEAWRDVYEYRAGHGETSKDPTWYIAPNGAPQNVVTTTDSKVRTRMRKVLAHSFTEATLKDQRPVIEGYANLFISRLQNMASTPERCDQGVLVDMTDWINFFTVDVFGDLAFGEAFGCLERSDYHPWVRTLFSFLKGMVLMGAVRLYPWVGAIVEKFFIPQSVMDQQRRHVEFASEKINRRLNLETSRPDFMTSVLQHNADFKYMSKGEIESNFTILIIAGSETTATILCGVLNCLTRSTEKLQTLEHAIRRRFEREYDISIDTTKDIPYLDAVINEGLRLCHPIPGGLPRIVPKGGATYVGYHLPGGTKVSIRPHIVSRSEKNFATPLEFHPERWLPLDQRPSQFVHDNLLAIKPFSTGPAGCPGKLLAWAEMRLILAKLVWAFDISVDPDRIIDWTKLKAMMTVEKEPMFLRLKKRCL